jgi:hypothetical protein
MLTTADLVELATEVYSSVHAVHWPAIRLKKGMHQTMHHSMQLQSSDCKICFGPHDDEIHSATVSIRQWFREWVTLGLYDDDEVVTQDEEAIEPIDAVA